MAPHRRTNLGGRTLARSGSRKSDFGDFDLAGCARFVVPASGPRPIAPEGSRSAPPVGEGCRPRILDPVEEVRKEGGRNEERSPAASNQRFAAPLRKEFCDAHAVEVERFAHALGGERIGKFEKLGLGAITRLRTRARTQRKHPRVHKGRLQKDLEALFGGAREIRRHSLDDRLFFGNDVRDFA